MKFTRHKEIKCYVCGENIDRSACDIDYAILTSVNHRSSPIKKRSIYLCSLHSLITKNTLLHYQIKNANI